MGERVDDAALVELLMAYQAGGIEPFEALYAALAPDVQRYFARIVGDSGAAADLVQETFLELHRSRHTYTPPLPVRPWVFGIARHVRWRHRRAMWRRSQHEVAESIDMSESPAAVLVSTVDRHVVDDAIRRLPATRRDVWVLHHVHGFSFREIARRLRIGVGAAKLRSSRAMRTLRSLLDARSRP